MPPVALLQEDADRDNAFAKSMHGRSAHQPNAFLSMMKKDGQSHRMVTDDYLSHWEAGRNGQEGREGRKAKYMSLVNK